MRGKAVAGIVVLCVIIAGLLLLRDPSQQTGAPGVVTETSPVAADVAGSEDGAAPARRDLLVQLDGGSDNATLDVDEVAPSPVSPPEEEIEEPETSLPYIEGRVVDAGTGQPVREFEIVLHNRTTAIVPPKLKWKFVSVSHTEGRFRLPIERSSRDEVTVIVRASGFATAFHPLLAPVAGRDVAGIVVALHPGAEVSGYVRDEFGAPIGGARVYTGFIPRYLQEREEAWDALAAPDGSFHLEGLAAAATHFGAWHPDYAPSVTIAASLSGSEPIIIILSSGGVLEGKVTLAGEPLKDCYIRMFQMSDSSVGVTDTRSDENGEFRIERLRPGAYELGLTISGRNPGEIEQRSMRYEALIAAGATTYAEFDFVPATAAIEGTITVDGEETREARLVVDVMVINDTREISVVQSRDGRYRIEDLPPGEAALNIAAVSRDGGNYKTTRHFELIENEVAIVDVDFTVGSVVAGQLHAFRVGYEGSVFIVPGNQPLERWSPEIAWALRDEVVASASLEEDGTFRLAGLDPGEYTVVILMVLDETPDPAGSAHIASFFVELLENEEIWIEHTFE